MMAYLQEEPVFFEQQLALLEGYASGRSPISLNVIAAAAYFSLFPGTEVKYDSDLDILMWRARKFTIPERTIVQNPSYKAQGEAEWARILSSMDASLVNTKKIRKFFTTVWISGPDLTPPFFFTHPVSAAEETAHRRRVHSAAVKTQPRRYTQTMGSLHAVNAGDTFTARLAANEPVEAWKMRIDEVSSDHIKLTVFQGSEHEHCDQQ